MTKIYLIFIILISSNIVFCENTFNHQVVNRYLDIDKLVSSPLIIDGDVKFVEGDTSDNYIIFKILINKIYHGKSSDKMIYLISRNNSSGPHKYEMPEIANGRCFLFLEKYDKKYMNKNIPNLMEKHNLPFDLVYQVRNGWTGAYSLEYNNSRSRSFIRYHFNLGLHSFIDTIVDIILYKGSDKIKKESIINNRKNKLFDFYLNRKTPNIKRREVILTTQEICILIKRKINKKIEVMCSNAEDIKKYSSKWSKVIDSISKSMKKRRFNEIQHHKLLNDFDEILKYIFIKNLSDQNTNMVIEWIKNGFANVDQNILNLLTYEQTEIFEENINKYNHLFLVVTREYLRGKNIAIDRRLWDSFSSGYSKLITDSELDKGASIQVLLTENSGYSFVKNYIIAYWYDKIKKMNYFSKISHSNVYLIRQENFNLSGVIDFDNQRTKILLTKSINNFIDNDVLYFNNNRIIPSYLEISKDVHVSNKSNVNNKNYILFSAYNQ